MLSPVNTSISPPNGWSVTIPNAGPEIREQNFNAWLGMVLIRLRANNLATAGWQEYVLDLMCQQRPDITSEDKDAPPERLASSEDVRHFIHTIWDAWKSGAVAVSAEEQDRRAAICMKCPKKGIVNCIGGCGALAEALAQITIGSQARSIPELHKKSCMVCGCELSTLTMYPLEVLKKVDEKLNFKGGEYPDFCWKLEDQNESSAQPPPD